MYKLSFLLHTDTQIRGGSNPIVGNDLTNVDMTSLRKQRIIFMGQICSIDGNFLKSWNEIKSTPGNNFKGKSSGRFTKLENKGILSEAYFIH